MLVGIVPNGQSKVQGCGMPRSAFGYLATNLVVEPLHWHLQLFAQLCFNRHIILALAGI